MQIVKYGLASFAGLAFGAIAYVQLPYSEAVMLNLTISVMVGICAWFWVLGELKQ